MLFELIEYCLTPASSKAKQSGYLYEAMAFQAKAKRNRKAWQSHWDNCHQQVNDFVSRHPSAKSLMILGSGCLFEIPKELVAQKIETLILVDQVFPLKVRKWAKKQKIKIQLIELDITQGLPKGLTADLILSSNLLSQLTLVEQTEDKKKEIEQRHLRDLQNLKRPCLLWTDVQRVYKHKKTDQVVETEKTVFSQLPDAQKSWSWQISPAPEFDRSIDVSLEVKCLSF